jgi:hypothetical protein
MKSKRKRLFTAEVEFVDHDPDGVFATVDATKAVLAAAGLDFEVSRFWEDVVDEEAIAIGFVTGMTELAASDIGEWLADIIGEEGYVVRWCFGQPWLLQHRIYLPPTNQIEEVPIVSLASEKLRRVLLAAVPTKVPPEEQPKVALRERSGDIPEVGIVRATAAVCGNCGRPAQPSDVECIGDHGLRIICAGCHQVQLEIGVR